MTVDDRIERFVADVSRHLYLKPGIRRRIIDELRTSFEDSERPLEEVIDDMGNPRRLASEIMKAYSTDYESMGFLNALRYSYQTSSVRIE